MRASLSSGELDYAGKDWDDLWLCLAMNVEPNPPTEQEEGCPVCGDRVSGYHYGLLTCESCKGFFKRSVQNNKRYTCAERQSCPMDPAQRKRCPFCRFQKCLAVGMKREAVRADRMRGGRNKFGPLYRRDRQLKQQLGVFHQHSGAPHRIKLEGTQTQAAPLLRDFHLLPNATPAPLHHEAFHQTPPLSAAINQSEMSVLLDSSPPAPSAPLPPAANTPTPNLPSTLGPPQPSSLLTQLLQGEPDEGQLSARVLACLQREQASRGKHDRLNTFSIMCKMADQTLFGLVEWARSSTLFKELKVEDQMVLLQSCWSELLVLDHLCRQVSYGRDGCIYLVTGQQVNIHLVLAGVTLSSLVSRAQDLVSKLRSLQLDRQDFVCLKYLVLFNPDVKVLQERGQVERTQESVNRALMEHTLQSHPRHSDKFGQLLLRLPEVRSISLQVEEYLYQRHLLGDLPCNSLLTEMLHAKHS
uniref:Uncharacterized protein n=1 Tax=Denticeps clupeoides TaxID=299321 RepID=A0AAY4AQS8_9TELE